MNQIGTFPLVGVKKIFETTTEQLTKSHLSTAFPQGPADVSTMTPLEHHQAWSKAVSLVGEMVRVDGRNPKQPPFGCIKPCK